MRRDLVRIVGIGLVCIGVSLLGWKGATLASGFGSTTAGFVTFTKNGTVYRTDVATVTQKVQGRVITLPGGTKVVHVPLVIVHTDHKVIRVPAHNLPIRTVERGLVAATVAQPLVPVTVTVYVPSAPEVVTSVVTSVSTVTTWIPTTITVTLPLNTTGPDT